MHKTMRTRSFALKVVIAAVAISSLAATAQAERRNPLAGQPAVRNRSEMRKHRFEITPQFTASTNQDYKHAIGLGGQLRFNIFDWLGVGFEGSYTFNTNTALEDKIRGKLTNKPAGDYQYGVDGPAPFLSIHDQHVLGIQGLMSAFVSVTPFSGKFSFFSALFLNYDLYITGGLGIVNYVQNGCCTRITPTTPVTVPDPNIQSGAQYAGYKVGGTFSVGAHLYFNEWVGLMIELRDYIVSANPGGLDANGDRRLTGDDESIQNNLVVNLGVTFVLPPKAKITH